MTSSRTPAASRASISAAAAVAVVLALSQLSCAASGLSPAPNMPVARAGLRPEYRIFYDELGDYGDWILIEPYGYVFRPRTRFSTWSPYGDGFWSPSDSYGWVWVSAEPFGWATFHYGRWLDDDFQGWVWVPGVDWAPAWVAWVGNGNLVGWAPLPPGSGVGGYPGLNGFQFASRSDMGSTDLKTRLLPHSDVARVLQRAEPIENTAEVDGVEVNLGPKIDWVEEVTGPLKRARMEHLLVSTEKTGASETPAAPAGAKKTEHPRDDIQKLADGEAKRVRSIIQQKQPTPDVINLIKPVTAAAASKQGREPAPLKSKAPPDTSR